MNCEDVPMSEWDKLTGAEEEAKEESIPQQIDISILGRLSPLA